MKYASDPGLFQCSSQVFPFPPNHVNVTSSLSTPSASYPPMATGRLSPMMPPPPMPFSRSLSDSIHLRGTTLVAPPPYNLHAIRERSLSESTGSQGPLLSTALFNLWGNNQYPQGTTQSLNEFLERNRKGDDLEPLPLNFPNPPQSNFQDAQNDEEEDSVSFEDAMEVLYRRIPE